MRLNAEEMARLAQQKAAGEKANGGQAPASEIVSVKASAYKMTGIKWLWQDRFAIGKLGIIAGLPDEGKGQTLAYIAAQVTNGGKWPMNEGRSPQGSVVVFSDEDDPNDTLVPRFAAAGADLDRVHIVKMVRDDKTGRLFSLVSDLEALRRKILEIGDVRLVLIDPISAYLGVGKVNSFHTADVRGVLTPLTTLAIETKVAIISVMHFNKKIDVTNALLRISDSLAFGAVARHVYGVIDDTENERKLFVRAKNNVAAKTKNKTLAYRFGARMVGKDEDTGDDIMAPYVLWEPQYVDVTAVEAMQAAVESKSPAARDEAKKFLSDILAKGPVLKTEIEEAAEANGIAEKTLYRAKSDLKVIAVKDRTKHEGKWTWELPPPEPLPKSWHH
jgi:putative DNA primase/helicase